MKLQEIDEKMATLLDTQFRIPGTHVRFGWDAILGLLPGVGDSIGAIISLYFIVRGIQEKLPIRILMIMLGNILLECLLGSIPIIGDVFDVFFKANIKNLDLLQRFAKR
ncbi:MAG: DUF4112 domain-containing protein [Deltaproteobacteria bacterium]|nr:DUF4112 domain-containing protein [Deltaproteobacteria bacterium]